jgi:23S rRNA (cytosine1962-C5)-methyltransferase
MSQHPTIRLQPGRDRRIRAGHPWAYSNELQLDAAAKALPAGSVINLADANGRNLGTATFNLHSLIAVRLYARHPDAALDAAFLTGRLRAALALRERLYDAPFYRLVHAEGDALPGFVIDRYGDVVAVQANTAGAEALTPAMVEALQAVLKPSAIVLRNDADVRRLEGLETGVRLAAGALDGAVEIVENGCRFLTDPLGGQKTGFYFDLSQARGEVARLARGGSMLDLYCHTGAFGLQALQQGATSLLAIDRSEPALAIAAQSAALNGQSGKARFERNDAFAALEKLGAEGTKFATVVADPPSFVKSKKELASGARGYRKLARLAAAVTAPHGFQFIASCSHNMPAELFDSEIAAGLAAANRSGRILYAGGAAPDHPVPPSLPEAAYIKYRILQLD